MTDRSCDAHTEGVNPMSCRCNSRALSAYLDGALSARKAEALARHLRVCSRCREELAALTRVRDLFEAWEPAPPRAHFAHRLNLRLDREAGIALPIWLQWAARRLVPLAVAAATVVAVTYLLNRAVLGPEPVTVDAYLNRSLDQDMQEMATVSEADLSKDRVLDLVLAGGGR